MKLRRLIFYIIFFLAILNLAAEVYTPEMMPNVNIQDRTQYISDPGGQMSPSTKARVNNMLWNLRQNTTAEVVVALPPDIGDQNSIEEWSEQLFTLWGIGKSDKDNGLLLTVDMTQRKMNIETGYGLEGVLPDLVCKKILNEKFIPAMKSGGLDVAVESTIAEINKILTDPAYADEIRSRERENYSGQELQALDSGVIWEFAGYVAFFFFIFSISYFVYEIIYNRKLDRYHKALRWRSSLRYFAILAVVSGGSGLIFLLMSWLLYRHNRVGRLNCPTCGVKMKRLPEDKDNELLSASQDLEERLDTVDYDVWECSECGTIERYAFKKYQTKYSECPNCHTLAMAHVGTHTIKPATTRYGGVEEDIFECQYCHNQHRRERKTPKKENLDNLALAAAIGAAAAGRRGGGFGGGDSFGGGFGGGSTGGGGASGEF